MHAEAPIWVQLGQQNVGAFLNKHIVWIPALIIQSHVRRGGFSGFATFRFGVGAANDSAIREEDEKIGQR